MHVGGMLFTQHTGGTQELGQSSSYFLEYLQGDWGEGRRIQLKPQLTFFKQVTQDKAISGKVCPMGLMYLKAAKSTGKETYKSLRGCNCDHQEDAGLQKLPKAFLSQFLEVGLGH